MKKKLGDKMIKISIMPDIKLDLINLPNTMDSFQVGKGHSRRDSNLSL